MNSIRLFISVLCLLLAGAANAAEEDAPKRLSGYLGIGPTLVGSPETFRDSHKTGFHFLTGLGYRLNPYTEMIGRLEFHLVSVDVEDRFGTEVFFDGGGVDMLLVGTDVKLSARKAPAPLRPYMLGGGGLIKMSQSSVTTDIAFEQYASLLIENQTKFYFNLGLGIDVKPMKNLNMFLVIRYMGIRQEGDALRFIPITVGLVL